MRKTFIESLPHGGKYISKNRINWSESIGFTVEFVYDNIKGKVEIIDYNSKEQNLYIKYKDKEIFEIKTNHFQECKLGELLGIYSKEYKYKVNEIITDVRSGKLKILKQSRKKDNRDRFVKYYKYQCLICGHIDTILEGNLISKKGCNVCSNIKIIKGINDMWTTNPNLAKLLANPEDGYRYTQSSSKPINWKCPDCGNIIKQKTICDINRQGLSCPKCSDGIPYPEKIMYFILEYLDIEFKTQLSKTTFKWCNKYYYDFYFKINNEEHIIETHGLQHYEKSNRGRSLKEEQENDKIKKELALQNNIKEENYIVIDCRYSTLEWIRDNENGILHSKLPQLLNFKEEDIDWLKCEEFALSNLVKQACNLWNDGINSTVKIGKIMKINNNTISRYLKQGSKVWDWCNYNSKEEQIKNGKELGGWNKLKVICLNNKKIYNSLTEASEIETINNKSDILACCQNRTKYSGIDIITKEKLQWQYYDEYLTKPKKLLSNDEINSNFVKLRGKEIICLNNNKKFKSITEAEKFYNIKHICDCCQGKRNYAGKDPMTGEPLHWMYYEEYLKLENKDKVV